MKQLFLALLLTSLLASSAFSQKQQLDRETKNLKGSVQRVDTAIANSSSPEAKRQRISTEEFDDSGNLTVETRYDEFGNALVQITYSFLDGERVVKEESKNIKSLTPGNRPTRPAERRYTAKLKYKYDGNGNRIESTQVLSDGSTPIRQVYTFTDNQREELNYAAGGSLIYKYVHKLDDKGNEVETITTRYEGSRDPVQGTTTYKYLDFDSQGNWTKRLESRGSESWIIYRQITYH